MGRRKKSDSEPDAAEELVQGDDEMDEAYAARQAMTAAARQHDQPQLTVVKEKPAKKQAELAGFERDSDPVLDKLASDYAAKSHQRGLLSADLKTLNAKLQQAMQERGITSYRFVDGEVERDVLLTTSKTKVKVVAVKDDDEGGGGEE